MIRIVVSGICGRMGSETASAVIERDDMVLAGGLERGDHRNLGMKLCDLWEGGSIEMTVRGSLDEFSPDAVDVVVDFSVREQTLACAEFARKTGTALVVGTTGLDDDAREALRRAAGSAAVVLAPNTSVGVNLLFGLVERVDRALGGTADVEIVEAHHRAKKDAPSGTASRIVELLSEARDVAPENTALYGRHGMTGPRPSGEIGVHSVRGGSVAGRHDVHFMTDLEVVTLSHEALSRRAFAEGALYAARFAAGAEPGFYGMEHALGLAETDGAS
ncbi:MAG: 4-hydroxy-tetrahydrodipicolinate reductase [Candidatus Eisenbacteria bacterium]|nr:4-hydroxy-tetrahydrodipicolinate reductase [Candidatus Eisenbacteria bacterium]